MLQGDDINYIELFLASDVKLIRYQVRDIQHDQLQVHQIISQAISSMIFKLWAFLEKSQVNSHLGIEDNYSKES